MLLCIHASATDPIRIMPLGDSITCGLIIPAPGNVPGGYRTQLWKDLTNGGYSVDFVGASQQNPDPGNLPDPDHNGYGGWTIEQIDAKIGSWMAAEKPAVVLLHIGTNDAFRTPSSDVVSARLNKLISDITTQSPQTHLIVAKIINASDPKISAWVDMYNGLIPGIVAGHAKNGELVTMVDMTSVVPANAFADPYHPNKAGYDLMGDAWFNAIKALGPINNPTETPEPCSAVVGLSALFGALVYAWWRGNDAVAKQRQSGCQSPER
jgi:lysophospholipase L1-like esterase